MVCAGVPAVKWLANKQPEDDINTLQKLVADLKTVFARKFVLISTIDVYPDPSIGGDEDTDCSTAPNHAYGAHRLWFEEQMKTLFDGCVIIRLPALFGEHLKKNYIYDLLNDRVDLISQINLDSTFQWYDVSLLWQDIDIILKSGARLVNLFTEPLSTRAIVENCFPQYLSEISPIEKGGATASYNLGTKYGNLWAQDGKYIQRAEFVLQRLKSFVGRYINCAHLPSTRLCISNIAWGPEQHGTIAQILKSLGIRYLELAPTKVFHSWEEIKSAEKVDCLKHGLHEHGLQVISLQSVLFNKPSLELFATNEIREDLSVHTKSVIDLASRLGARVIVWGSPKQRQTNGRAYEECFTIACDWFQHDQ